MPDPEVTVLGIGYRNIAYEGDEVPTLRNNDIKRSGELVIHNDTITSEVADKLGEVGKTTAQEITIENQIDGNNASTKGESSNEDLSEPPDGGWGWVVALGAFISQTMVNVLLESYGILYSEFLLDLETSALVSSWIFNIMGFNLMFSGLFVKAFVEEFGLRKTGFFGTIMIFVGTGATAFADSPWIILIFYSFIVGTGNGLLGPLSYGVSSYYFKKRIGAANAFMTAGVSVGQIIGPLLIARLKDQYAYQGSLLVLSGFLLNGLVGTSVFHPPQWHGKRPTALPKAAKNNQKTSEVFLRMMKNVLKTLLLIRSPVAAIVAIAVGLNTVTYLNFLTILPFAMQEEGFTIDDAAYCVSLSGFVNLVSRLAVSVLSDYSWFSTRLCYMAGTLIITIFTAVYLFIPDLTFKFVVLGVWGSGVGMVMGLVNIVMIEFVGREQHINVLSLNCFISSIWFISTGPILGLIRDLSGSYTYSNFFLAATTLGIFIMFVFLPAAQNYERNNNDNRKLVDKEERI